MTSIIRRTKWLNPVTYTNFVRPRKIVQVNTLHSLYDIIVIEIFKVKFVYTIYPWDCYQGITLAILFLKYEYLQFQQLEWAKIRHEKRTAMQYALFFGIEIRI